VRKRHPVVRAVTGAGNPVPQSLRTPQFVEQIVDVEVVECATKIEPDCVLNHDGRESVSLVEAGCVMRKSLPKSAELGSTYAPAAKALGIRGSGRVSRRPQ